MAVKVAEEEVGSVTGVRGVRAGEAAGAEVSGAEVEGQSLQRPISDGQT